MKDKIFISYCHSNRQAVDTIDNDLSRVGITLTRDVRDVKYGEKFSTFMKSIRLSYYVIMVISDEYLKSKNCMYEVLEFKKENNYFDRIMFVVLDNAKKIYDSTESNSYITYWEDKLEEQKKVIGSGNIMNRTIQIEECKQYERICREIDEFMSLVRDTKHVPLHELKQSSYKDILEFIKYGGIKSLIRLIEISKMTDSEEQEIELDRYINEFGDTSRYYFFKAFLATDRGEYKKAKYNYEKSIEINPEDPAAHNNLAILLETDYYKEYEGAKKHYEKTIEIDPENAIAHDNLARLLQTDYYKEYEGAKKHYEKAIEINPEYADAHHDLAFLLQTDYYKEYERAKKHYEKAIEISPEDAHSHYNLAILLGKDYYKDYKGAKKHYEKAIEINPEDTEAHNNLAILLETDYYKNYEGAKKHYEKAIEIYPEYADAHYNLAILLTTDYYKDYKGAKKHYEKAIEINPNDEGAHNNLALLLQTDYYREYKKAKKHYKYANRLRPDLF